MSAKRKGTVVAVLLAAVLFVGAAAEGQQQRVGRPDGPRPPAVPDRQVMVVPQARAFSVDRAGGVRIAAVDASVVIRKRVATTTMEVSLKNSGGVRLESVLLVPVPDGAVVRGFSYRGARGRPTARLLPREEARKIYRAIVSRMRDPALLEFVGYRLVRSSVFPVEPGGTQKVKLVYEHVLSADGNRVDYVLPRSESLDCEAPWDVKVYIEAERPVSTVYSPSHKITMKRSRDGVVVVRTAEEARKEPGPFLLSYLLEGDGVTASVFACPDPSGGGYFLLLAGLPVSAPAKTSGPAVRREITLVIDRSGSMRGERLEQVREAAARVIDGLEEGEAFNILIYGNTVDAFSERSVLKTKESAVKALSYIKSIRACGGTNIHAALLEALRRRPTPGTLPMVLFLTDGLPTVGETSERAIRRLAAAHNPYGRRVFTFGVGVEVNTPLLDRIARQTGASATFVLPKESVRDKVAQVFRRLSGPVLADVRLEVLDAEGKPSPSRVRDLIPADVPDMFDGDQLVLLGRYVGEGPLVFRVSGDYFGKKRSFEFGFETKDASQRNAFVPRLWASRKIAVLADAIRRMGADEGPALADEAAERDPRMRELVDEIVRLSLEFGVLTEYTAFLAREGTDLSRRDALLVEAMNNFRRRAVETRSGVGAVNQELNLKRQREERVLNRNNKYLDRNMNLVALTNVKQIGNRAFYNRGGRWVDGRVVQRSGRIETKPDRVVEFGGEEFDEILKRLVKEGAQGSVALAGDVLLLVDGETVLVRGPSGSANSAK